MKERQPESSEINLDSPEMWVSRFLDRVLWLRIGVEVQWAWVVTDLLIWADQHLRLKTDNLFKITNKILDSRCNFIQLDSSQGPLWPIPHHLDLPWDQLSQNQNRDLKDVWTPRRMKRELTTQERHHSVIIQHLITRGAFLHTEEASQLSGILVGNLQRKTHH